MAQYRAVLGEEAWERGRSRYPQEEGFQAHQGPNKSITHVTRAEAQEFATSLEVSAVKSVSGYTYRLPTEEEWEYASRADRPDQARYGELGRIAWTGGGDTPFADVGKKVANGWGFHDLLGLGLEWCDGETEEGKAVVRGGSYQDGTEFARASARTVVRPEKSSGRIGFRVALGVRM